MTNKKLDAYVTQGTLHFSQKGMRGGFDAVSGVVSQSRQNDTAFVDLIVEYNKETGKAFMMPKAPLALRVALDDVSLETALHIGAHAVKDAFAAAGVELGRYVGAYSRDRKPLDENDKGMGTYWLRFNLPQKTL